MSATEILEQIRRLPEKERRDIASQILEEFGDSDDALSLEQIDELERRADRVCRNPKSGITWEQICESHELTPGEAELIDQRLQDHLDNSDDVVSLAEVKTRFDTKYRK